MVDGPALTVSEEPIAPWPRLGVGPQVRYRFSAADGPVGEVVVALENRHVGWASVDPSRRGRGLGRAMHEVLLGRLALLVVEQQCSPDERRVVDSLGRRGWVGLHPTAIYAGEPPWVITTPGAALRWGRLLGSPLAARAA